MLIPRNSCVFNLKIIYPHVRYTYGPRLVGDKSTWSKSYNSIYLGLVDTGVWRVQHVAGWRVPVVLVSVEVP